MTAVFVLAVPPVLVSMLVGLGGPRLASGLSGRAATVVITAVSWVCALAMGLVTCAIGALALAEWTPLADVGHWSPAVLAAEVPLPRPIEVACLSIGAGLIAASVAQLVTCLRLLRPSFGVCRGSHAELIVIDDGPPEAYALAGLPGRTVVSRSMLRLLSASERSALLAHERSHVRHHHFVYLNLVQLAAAANPFLRPLVATVGLAVERWADADAATDVGDRQLVATTLARASLASNGQVIDRPAASLAVASSDVRQRVDALTQFPRRRWSPVITVALLTVSVWAAASSGLVGLHLHHVLEWAQWIQAHRGS